MNKPLVSIIVPTYNSEKTLPLCLQSIKKQTYKNVEVIIVDSYSKDKTVKIAEKFGTKIIQTHGGLLWARYIGHRYARGEIELLLDSDQMLDPATIERGVHALQNGYDALMLEETGYKPETLAQWLFYFDRKHVQAIRDLHPIHGVLLARMYRYEILEKAFNNIRQRLPTNVMYKLVSQDHALIYYESWKYINRIGILKKAIYHIEPDSLTKIIRKFYRYGRTEYSLSRFYPELSKGKKTPRKISIDPEGLASLLLWILKAIPYAIGKALSTG